MTTAVAHSQADDRLPELVREAARQLHLATTAAEVLAAREKAGAVYDQAKRAARLAKAVGAHDKLVSTAHRVQADALEIESLAKRRLADEYDAAQERGEVAGQGKRPNISNGNVSTAADVGLSGKQIYEARQIRDAIREEPGIVRRALDELMASGDEPTRAALKRELGFSRENLRAAVGTDTATAAERGNNLYETPPEAMRALLSIMRFSRDVWEPACGKGAISRELEAAGYDVYLSDLVDYGTASVDGECQGVCDFLATTRDDDAAPGAALGPDGSLQIFGRPDIVTNPPYGENLNAFVAHALKVHRPRRMALLLNLNFLCGFDDADRNFAMDECPPATVWVFKRRLPMMHRDGWDGPEASSRMNTAWFVWELDEETGTYDAGGKRGTQIVRIDWKTFENSKALGPEDPAAATSSRPPKVEAGAAPPPAAPASRPSVTQEELDEWRLLGIVDGGATVTGAAVDEMVERGLIWRGQLAGNSSKLCLTEGGAERLAELEPRVKAASDGDAVKVQPAQRGFKEALSDWSELNRLNAKSELSAEEIARRDQLAPVVAADLAPVDEAEGCAKRRRGKAVPA